MFHIEKVRNGGRSSRQHSNSNNSCDAGKPLRRQILQYGYKSILTIIDFCRFPVVGFTIVSVSSAIVPVAGKAPVLAHPD